MVIDGDNVRFQAHQKTNDTLKINGLSGHDRRYRDPIFYKNAKKANPIEYHMVMTKVSRKDLPMQDLVDGDNILLTHRARKIVQYHYQSCSRKKSRTIDMLNLPTQEYILVPRRKQR